MHHRYMTLLYTTSCHLFVLLPQGYAERKVLLLCDVVGVCKKLHNEGVRKERLAALKATRTVSFLVVFLFVLHRHM